MATLRQEPLSFPWELFQQAQDSRNRNQRQMFQDIQGMGQGLGQIGLDVAEYQKQKKADEAMKQLLAVLGGQGQPTAGVDGVGVPPQMQQPQMAGVGGMQQAPAKPQMPDLARLAGLAQGAGLKDNPFMEQLAKSMSPQETAYQKDQMDEKVRADKASEEIRLLGQETQRALAEGRHVDALARLEQIKGKIREDAIAKKRAERDKLILANQKVWMPWNKVAIPPDPDAESGGGLSPEEAAELRALDAKYGASR